MDKGFFEKNQLLFKAVGTSIGTDFTGAQSSTPVYLMDSILIGGKEFPPHQVVLIDLSHINMKAERKLDFILGYTTLSKANWIFDFPKRKWSITKMNL